MNSEFLYPTKLIVTCNSDSEYRTSMRLIMKMKTPSLDLNCMDSVSADESDFDPDAALTFMKKLYEKTETNPDLMKLYIASASVFLTEDPTTGIAVLFAYDNLEKFHKCLSQHFDNEDEPLTKNEHYMSILSKMTTVRKR